MPVFSLRKLFATAATVAWRNRKLWWLGLLASGLGVAGEFLALFTYAQMTVTAPTTLPFPFGFLARVADGEYWVVLWQARPGVAVGFLAVLIAGAAVLLWLASSSLGGLFSALPLAYQNKSVSLRIHFRIGQHYLVQMLTLTLVGLATTYAAIFVANVAYFSFWLLNVSADVYVLVALVLLILVVSLAATLVFWTRFAQLAVILHDTSLWQAMRAGGQMLRGHWLASVEVGALLLLVDLLAVIGITYIVSPFALLVNYALRDGDTDLMFVGLGVGAGLFLMLFIFLAGALSVYHVAVWTAWYEQLQTMAPGTGSLTHRSWLATWQLVRRTIGR